jgi:hypothetical protein
MALLTASILFGPHSPQYNPIGVSDCRHQKEGHLAKNNGGCRYLTDFSLYLAGHV